MKKSKFILAALAVVATAGSAFAVKTAIFGSGSVYCNANCTQNRISARLDPSGSLLFTTVCSAFTGETPHVLTRSISTNTITCNAVVTGSKFSATAAGK